MDLKTQRLPSHTCPVKVELARAKLPSACGQGRQGKLCSLPQLCISPFLYFTVSKCVLIIAFLTSTCVVRTNKSFRSNVGALYFETMAFLRGFRLNSLLSPERASLRAPVQLCRQYLSPSSSLPTSNSCASLPRLWYTCSVGKKGGRGFMSWEP